MKNNDKNYDAIPLQKFSKKKITPKVNINSKREYKNILLCPLNKHDAVNSIDILDDVIIYGTIMGNVYLCRIDKNNLIPKTKKQINTDLNFYDINKEINTKNMNDDSSSSKISCIKLDKNYNNKSLSNNNSIYKINKIENNPDKNKNCYDSDIVPTTRTVYNKFLNHELNTKRKILNKINKNILENKNSQSDQSIFNNQNQKSLISQSNNSKVSNNITPLPQIVQLVTNANENIPCLNFDTKDRINVAIGDSDIIRFENLTNFNFENEDESYYYTQIKNYQSENDHIKYCEGAICLMSNNHFLLLFSPLIDYSSFINYNKYSYINKTITTYDIIKGEIEMYNFLVPFDFDGDRFLYLEYISESIRRICVYHTLSQIGPIIFKMDKSFGHVSFMKFISLNRIVICRKNKLCEIRDINDNFKLIETWEHIGEEIISMNVYIKGTKNEDEKEKFENSLMDLSYKKNKENNDNIEYFDTSYKRNKKTKSKNKLSLNENSYGFNTKIHLKKFLSEKDKINNSTYRDLIGLNLKNQLKSHEKKDDEIAIYNNKNKFNSGKEKENLTNEFNINKKNLDILTNNNEYNYIQSRKEFLDKKSKISYYINQKLDHTDKCIEEDAYIITLDKNGNFNKYHNGKIKTLFNLYDIKNIDQNYKDEEFFSLGFPYFIIMNNKYYAISTDHGIFVLSNKY